MVGPSRKIVSWWLRDATGIVKKHPQNAKFTRKAAEMRAKNPTSGFAVVDLL